MSEIIEPRTFVVTVALPGNETSSEEVVAEYYSKNPYGLLEFIVGEDQVVYAVPMERIVVISARSATRNPGSAGE